MQDFALADHNEISHMSQAATTNQLSLGSFYVFDKTVAKSQALLIRCIKSGIVRTVIWVLYDFIKTFVTRELTEEHDTRFRVLRCSLSNIC